MGGFGNNERNNGQPLEQSSDDMGRTFPTREYHSPLTRGGAHQDSIASPESLSLRRSRYGWVLVTALETWRQQRIAHAMDGTIIGITGMDTSSSPCEGLAGNGFTQLAAQLKARKGPFTCSVEDCYLSYRRKGHLNRHLLKHEGKLFDCSIENCSKRSAVQGNITRHVKEMHEGESSECGKQHVCLEVGCGKSFKYASTLRKHEGSHVKLGCTEVIGRELGCSKMFTNSDCLKAHTEACHRYILCETCGTKQRKKNIKRHMRIHEGCKSRRIKCSF